MPSELDAADDALAERDLLAGNIGARRREDAFQAGARIGRAADDLHGRAAPVSTMQTRSRSALGCGVASTIRAIMKSSSCAAGSSHMFDLEADARQRLDDLASEAGGVEMLFEPGEGEFHLLVALGFERACNRVMPELDMRIHVQAHVAESGADCVVLQIARRDGRDRPGHDAVQIVVNCSTRPRASGSPAA